MHRAARRMLMTRRGGYGGSPGAPMGGGGYNDGPGGSTLDSQGNAFAGGGYDDGDLDPFSAYAARVRQLESGGDPNAVTGHNYGLFQFGPEEMRKYGITDWRNPAQQYSGLQQEYAEHSRLLSQSGLPATPANLYLMHQQGVGGAPALLQANPDTPAWQVLRKFYPSDAVARKAISGNIPSNNPLAKADPSGITAGQFVDLWKAKYGGQPIGDTQVATATPSAGDVGTLTSGVPTTPDNVGMLSKLLGGNDAMGGNPLMGMAGNLMNQQAPAPQLTPPQPVHPNINPQALLQQQALLHGILNPQFRGLMG